MNIWSISTNPGYAVPANIPTGYPSDKEIWKCKKRYHTERSKIVIQLIKVQVTNGQMGDGGP